MRVTYVVPQLFDATDGVLGGAERYAFELARHMARLTSTRLVCFGRRPFKRVVDSLQIEMLRPLFRLNGQPSNPMALRALRVLTQSDIVHVHQSYILVSTLLAVLGRFCRTPVFTTDLGGGGLSLAPFLDIDRWYSGHLHISYYSRAVYGHGTSPRARVIGGGVDASRFTPGKGGGGALFVGRLLPHKGIDLLLRALPSNLPLTVVGTSLHPEYRQRLDALALGKQVRFVEAVTDPELVSLYQASDVIVLPSVYRDCYGNTTRVPELLGQTLLEGMAAGLPAIATRVASLPELVEDEVTGFLVDANSVEDLRRALCAILASPQRARAMGLAGRERARNQFSWLATARRCLSAYRELA